MVKININVDVKPRGMASAYIGAPYDKGRRILAEKGYKEICLQENARLRIDEGKDKFISENGNWVKEDAIYIPKKGKFLTNVSHISAAPKEATECHRKEEEFYLTSEQVEQSLADCVELSDKEIPTNRLADNKITAYAFGKDAEEYGRFLKEAGINEIPIWTADMEDKPFARKVWFRRLGDGRSDLYCDSRYLHDGSNGVRGVCESAESAAKNFEAYNVVQLEKALKELRFSGIAKGLIEKLRNQ